MTQSNSNASVLIRPNVAPGTIDLVSRPTDFFDLLVALGLTGPTTGAAPVKWNLQSAGNGSAETFVENQAAPSAGRRTLVQASLAMTYYRTVAAITGHLLDNARKNGLYESNVWEAELADAVKALLYLLEQNLLGSTQDVGIASIIDAGDTYAGIAPGSVSAWAALETAVAGALTAAVMQDTYEALISAPYNAMPGVILAAVNQLTNYASIAGPAATTPQTRIVLPAQYDIGITAAPMSFNGIPLKPIRNMTSTEMYWLDLTEQKTAEGTVPGIQLQVHRDLSVLPFAITNDNMSAQVSMGCALRVANRRRHAKLTGITA